MERCKEKALRHASDQQQHEQQHQQHTTTEEQRSPFFSPTTPAWGDRNVSEQLMEETNNNIGASFMLVPSISDSRISTSNLSPLANTNSSSTRNLTENQSFIDSQLPRKCIIKLCPYVATDRSAYIDHIITHCTFIKSSYVENDLLKDYVEDDESEDSSESQTQSKTKKKLKSPKLKFCNKCDFMTKTKLALWLHLRQHFWLEECPGFICPLCPFATTLKHHMTFHWFSAHDDFKGYMCTECQYTCVSKSMLTSHMKTHSQIYQYNCGSCAYRTKFCNAIKKHLKDTLHVAGAVLNPDGTLNPFATIDVYGNKRGPRRKALIDEKKELTETFEDRPSTSGITLTVPTVPTSSTPIPLSPTSSNSPDLQIPLMSSARTTSASTFHTESIVENILAMFVNGMTNEDGIKTSINPNVNTNANPSVNTIANPFINLDTNEVMPTNMFGTLCELLISDMDKRPHLNDEERRRTFRILQNAHRYLLSSGHYKHVARATGGDRNLSDNARAIDESSTSTTINKSAISTVTDKPSTSTINKPSTSRAIDESSTSVTLVSEFQPEVEENEVPDEPMDLSMSTMANVKNQPQYEEPVASSSRRNKRKRKAMKLEYPPTSDNEDENQLQNIKPNSTNGIYMELPLPTHLTASQSDLQRKNETFSVTHNANIYNSSFICYHCHIIFANRIMYAVHMSFHDNENPLMCALCDQKSVNIIEFFLHLIRTKH